MIVVLGSGFAVAQGMPQQQPSSPQQPSTSSPSSTDQQPSTAPDQGKTLPNTDQNKDNQGAQKLPQSDAAPAATGDVQNNIQSAIQKDPTLASSNITVDVKNGKSVELMGTVPSKDAKESAERIAKENAGGLKVKSHLKVAAATDNAQPKSDKDQSNPKL
jgi:hypothetical protein